MLYKANKGKNKFFMNKFPPSLPEFFKEGKMEILFLEPKKILQKKIGGLFFPPGKGGVFKPLIK
jgi:hypothetical protein